jgi:TolB-like protein/DNA-binding winged helix-turn-helix (wHTH) protein/Tfp pilus assembly protein PilF
VAYGDAKTACLFPFLTLRNILRGKLPEMETSSQIRHIRFGAFEVDLSSGELFKHGIRIKVQDQPFQILTMLLERPGVLIPREELRRKLWTDDTFVDFDAGMNAAVRRLRDALNDSADNPRYIETLPRHGYRFIAETETVFAEIDAAVSIISPPIAVPAASLPGDTSPSPQSAVSPERRSPTRFWVSAMAATVGVVLFVGFGIADWRHRIFRTHASPRIQSIAVLPFKNLSGDPEQEYFVDGMTDALMTDLAQTNSLRVISSSSSMRYKGSTKTVREIGNELKVDAVIEGAVVRSGDDVRVDAQLIETSDDRHLWAKTYKRKIRDVLALQGDISLAITNEIQARLTPLGQTRLATARPINPDAYSAYLLGRYYLERGTRESLEKSRSYYEQAVQLDPGYALSWAGLADAHRLLGGGGFVPLDEAVRKARDAAERALELDPDLPEANAAMGSIHMWVDWDWDASQASYDRALAVEPGNISALRGAARLAADLGRFDHALLLARQAVERDPLNPRSQRLAGDIARYAGRLDEALAAFEKAAELDPHGPLVEISIGWIYLERSRPQEALAAMEQEKGPEYRTPGFAMAYYALLRGKESDAALAETIKNYGGTGAFQIAEVYAFRGEIDTALSWLERAYAQRDGALTVIKGDPLLRSLESDPRYNALLKRMHLPA